MRWRRQVNDTLSRLLGYRLVNTRRDAAPARRAPGDAVRPPAHPHDRLLQAPVLVLSSVRSGSTLLRAILTSHTRIHAPHETHFRRLTVDLPTPPVQQATAALGVTQSDIEHLLWDRLLHRELVASGKEVLVEKTPSNVFVYPRLATCWPDARFIFLLRHPLSIAQSWHEADPERRPMDEAVHRTYQYMKYLDRARGELAGIEVRYEDLTADPDSETQRICAFLNLDWEPGMTQYRRADSAAFVKGIGDWRDKINTGTVQPGRPLPPSDDVPLQLRQVARSWGYL